MGILSAIGFRGDPPLIGRKALTGTPPVLEALNQRLLNPYVPLGGTNLTARDRINSVYVATQNAGYGWIYKQQPSVRRVIDYLAGNVAQLGGPKLYERVSDDDRRHVPDHAAAECLRRPNTWTPGKKFIRSLTTTFLIYDNAYALKFRNEEGGPLTLVLLSPAMVGVVGQSHFQIEAYRIWLSSGERFDVAPTDMIHWRGEDPDDPRVGLSKLETLREELAADAAARQANTELHRSGLSMPGWIQRPADAPEISADGLKRLQESLTNRAKAGRQVIPVLEEGMTFERGGVTPEDAELLAARTWANEEVASLYGMKHVPPEGDEERLQVITDVLPDITGQLAAFLGLAILEAEYGLSDHYFEFDMDEKLMGNDRLKAITSAIGAPPLTRNEGRAMLNLPAKDGGDELLEPMNMTEGGKPSTGVMPIQDPNKPPQDGSARSDDAPTPIPARRASLNGEVKAPLIPRRRKASDRRDRWAGEYQEFMSTYFKRQRRSIKSKGATKAIVTDRWNRELGEGLNEIAARQFAAEGKHTAFRLASGFDPDQGENWLAAKAIGSAEAINRTTQQHADEMGVDEAFGQAQTRAVGAAMAYATDIAAFSTKAAAQQAPVEPTVIIDGGSCEVCAPYQGAHAMSELEAWPAYHANCECVADVQAGVKALEPQTKAQPITVNVAPPAVHIDLNVPEHLFQVTNNVEAAEAPNVNVAQPSIHVAPSELTISEGAIQSHHTIEAAPPPDVRIDKGAVQVQNNIEAAPPPDVRISEGAIQAHVKAGDVTVEAPAPVEAPEVNVEVKGGRAKKTITFSDGRTADITDETQTKRIVEFSDGRTAEINESDEDDGRPDQD